MSHKKTLVLGVTGSIAAYKAAEIISRFKKLGWNVRVILTQGGAHFITPLTLETLSASPVYTDQFSRETPYEVEHIALAKSADVFLIAPASANFIAKAANGIADDLLSTSLLATRAPVLIAPAMNSAMLSHAAVCENIARLKARGVSFIEPEQGRLACGDTGKGRLAQVDDIIEGVYQALNKGRDLDGKRILVTAGPTREYIDPVRYLTNRSTGRMGFAIAEAAAARGAKVSLITGPVLLETPPDVTRQDIVSSNDLCEAVLEAYSEFDALIMAAAPADFTMRKVEPNKIKKTAGEGLTLDLVPTQDILKRIGETRQKGRTIIMGFAAETQDIEANALNKLERKNLDFIAANDVLGEGMGFAVETNAVTLFERSGGKTKSGLMTKRALADWLLDALWRA